MTPTDPTNGGMGYLPTRTVQTGAPATPQASVDPYTQSANATFDPNQNVFALGGPNVDPATAVETAGAGQTWLSQMLGMYQGQQQQSYNTALQNQQQALEKLASGRAALQSILSQLTVNPQQTLQTNPLLPAGSPVTPGFDRSLLGPLTVPNTVFLGQYNQITDPVQQGAFQSAVTAAGYPDFNTYMARQQLINPQAGGYHFGMGLV